MQTTETPTSPDGAVFDIAVADDFAARMVGVLNEASLALMISIGHQVGLFDAMAALPASTADQIADSGRAAGALRPRVAGGHDHRAGRRTTTGRRRTYRLPPNTRPA